jgi:hypothetical protein
MPKITEGQYALGALTVFVIWVFFVLPFINDFSAIEHGEFWTAKLTDWLLALFTLALVFFTRELVRSTNRLWEAGEKQMGTIERNAQIKSEDTRAAIAAAITSNQIAVINAEQQLRAYVTAKDVNLSLSRGPSLMTAYGNVPDGPVLTYGFAAILRNGGQTPATNVTTNVSCRRFAADLPTNYDFSDSGTFGHGLIGPNSELYTPTISLATHEFKSDGQWYLWG